MAILRTSFMWTPFCAAGAVHFVRFVLPHMGDTGLSIGGPPDVGQATFEDYVISSTRELLP